MYYDWLSRGLFIQSIDGCNLTEMKSQWLCFVTRECYEVDPNAKTRKAKSRFESKRERKTVYFGQLFQRYDTDL